MTNKLPESVHVPVDILSEARSALDAALSLVEDSADTYGQVVSAREKLDAVIDANNATMRQNGYHLLRRLDELRRDIKRDYGLEK